MHLTNLLGLKTCLLGQSFPPFLDVNFVCMLNSLLDLSGIYILTSIARLAVLFSLR